MTNPILTLAAWIAQHMSMETRRTMYRFKPLAGLIRRFLNLAAPAGLSEVIIAAGELKGLKMLLDLGSEKDYWLGTYEPELQAAIARQVRPGMIAYDVGANVGYVSLMLARRLGEAGHVFAFEALPSNLERLRGNLALNRFTGIVEVVPAAVVDDDKTVRFMIGPSGGMGKAEGSAGRQDVAYPEAIEVAGVSLDSFVYRGGYPVPQVVKMDIEGGEVLALPGMQRLLVEGKPLVFMELHGPEAASVAWEKLRSASYRICSMQGDFPEVSSLEALDWKAYVIGFP